MNIDYEASLLTLYLDKVAMGKLIRLGMKEVYLDNENQVKAWQVSRDWYKDSGQTHAIPLLRLEEECEQYLKRMREYMEPFVEEPMNPEYLVKKLQGAYLQREGRVVLEEYSKWMDSDLEVEDAREYYAEYAKAVLDVLANSAEEKPLTLMQDDVDAHVELKLTEFDKWTNKEIPDSVSFGDRMIDEAYDGIRNDELTVIVAGTGVGKSLWLCQQAYAVAKAGRPVVLYTLENSVDMTYDRLLAITGGLDMRQVEKGAFAEGEAREMFRAVAGDEVFANLYVKQPKGPGRGLGPMYQEAAAVGAHLLLGDQFSHVEVPGKFNSDWEKYSEIARQAKNMTLDYGFPSVWACQLNREGAKKKDPNMTDIGRAWTIAQEADWGFIISPTDNNIINKVTCRKHRRGMDRTWYWSFEFAPARFEILREDHG